MKQTPLSAIMSTNVVVANKFHNFSQVLELFSKFGVHHLPMVDGNNKLIGIISSNDFMKIFTNPSFAGMPINIDELDKKINLTDIMTPSPKSLSPSSTVGDALDVFSEKKFMALPITLDNEVVGIVSIKDIIDVLN